MTTPPLTDEQIHEAIAALKEHGNQSAAAIALGIARSTFQNRIKRGAERGLLGTEPVIPGFAIKSIASKQGDAWIKQTKAPGEVFEMPEGFAHKRISNLSDGDGRTIARWDIVERDTAQQLAAMQAAVEAFKSEIPRAVPAVRSARTLIDLLNFYAVTDAHFGALSWREETGADWDLDIAETLLTDWFAAAIDLAPAAHTGVLAQMGDLAHYDGMESKTPTSGHILDADSRFPKVVRVIIRTLRRIVRMMLEKHERVHIIMADANHDPASGAWLREMFAAFYDDEPRVTVDS